MISSGKDCYHSHCSVLCSSTHSLSYASHLSKHMHPTEGTWRKCHTFCRERGQHFYTRFPSVQPAGIVQVFTRRTHHLHHKTKKCGNGFPVWIRKHSSPIPSAALKRAVLGSFLSLWENQYSQRVTSVLFGTQVYIWYKSIYNLLYWACIPNDLNFRPCRLWTKWYVSILSHKYTKQAYYYQ